MVHDSELEVPALATAVDDMPDTLELALVKAFVGHDLDHYPVQRLLDDLVLFDTPLFPEYVEEEPPVYTLSLGGDEHIHGTAVHFFQQLIAPATTA